MRRTEVPVVLSIVGRSNSGKTTLIEKIIPELSRRGWRVGTIKHNRHGFEIDHEGKDSYRHRKAGARITVIASPRQVAVIQDADRDYEIGELVSKFMKGVDIVLVEGYKSNDFPKIELRRAGFSGEPISGKTGNLIAYVGDELEEGETPFFHWDDIEAIVNFIESRFCRD